MTTRITITIADSAYSKIEHLKKSERMKSVSSMASRLIEEALEHYPNADSPRLPF